MKEFNFQKLFLIEWGLYTIYYNITKRLYGYTLINYILHLDSLKTQRRYM